MRDLLGRAGRTRPRLRAGMAVMLGALALGGAGIAQSASPGEIGPQLNLTGNGHLLHPVGRLTTVGDFPTGSAVMPGGQFLWVADCGHGEDDIKVVNIATGQVVQTLPLPGCYGGVAFSPDGSHAYVSGLPKGSSPTEGPTQGDQGDVIHIFTVDHATGTGTEQTPLALPATTGGSARVNSFPPVSGTGTAQPEGLAVSPDGRHLVVALNGADAADVVDLGSMAQTIVSVGQYPCDVVFDPQGRAYVTNEYSGTVSVIDPAAGKVTATVSGLGGALGDLNSHPEGMVADPHRPLVYVAVTNRDLIAVIDTARDAVTRTISVGRGDNLGTQPVKLAISPDGTTLYSADAGEDAVAAVALSARGGKAAGRPRRVFSVPSLRAISRFRSGRLKAARALRGALHRARARHGRGRRIAVRRAHGSYRRTLSRLTRRYLHLRGRRACAGVSRAQAGAYIRAIEKALGVRPGARRRFLERRAARRLPRTRRCPTSGVLAGLPAYGFIGRIPTAAYPDDVQTTPQGKLIWIAGKGFGSGPNPSYYFGGARTQYQTPPNAYGTYVLDLLIGRVGTLSIPTDLQVVADTAQANAQVAPSNAETQPAGSPIPAVTGQPSSQIKHVFYIVRENRTYDQIFGSDPRGDGNPGLELFDGNGVSGPTGGITPNAHALSRQFPLLDHFYEDSEVSVDGHLITAGATAIDYAQKATAANYSNRRGTYDFGIFPVSFPPRFFLFDQAAKQGVSFRDYGEAVGSLATGSVPNRPQFSTVEQNVDSSYPNNLFLGCLAPNNPAACTQDSGLYNGTGTLFAGQSRFDTWYPEFQSQVAAGTVPALNYMILPSDHTNGTTPGDPTPQALIADNDLALGQIVDAISHSSIWPSTAIFVVEDDSQDGADHVDAHRAPAFVISPWARHGAVVPTRYDQYSTLRTAELILGLQPLGLNDALATPMYDAFISGGAKPDDAPYTVQTPSYSLSTKNTSGSPLASLSRRLPFSRLDAVPQAISDQILWASVHGATSKPPAAGPNASPDEIDRAMVVEQMLRADPNIFVTRTGRAAHSTRATGAGAGASCPITWACRPAPLGDG